MIRLNRGDRLVLASHNQGKLAEFQALLQGSGVTLLSAGDLGLAEPDETVLAAYPVGLRVRTTGAADGDQDVAAISGHVARIAPFRRSQPIGVRVPAWPESAHAMGELPFALLASSANPSGSRAPRAVDEIEPGLLAACDLILDAGPVAGVASTILDLSAFATERTWRILRRGSVDEREVAAVLGADREVKQGS